MITINKYYFTIMKKEITNATGDLLSGIMKKKQIKNIISKYRHE